jgi:membrane protein implicated in regulation of membrane protease activity
MFLLGWILDMIFTIVGTLTLFLFFGNSPIIFIFFIIFPFVFITIWHYFTKKRGN